MTHWLETVFPVATFFLGGLSTHLRDSMMEKRQRAREESTRKADRERTILDRREAFELDNLGRLGEALSDLARAAGRAHYEDVANARTVGAYGVAQMGGTISEDRLLANRAVHRLAGLVLNDDLRASAERARDALNIPSGMRNVPVAHAETALTQAALAVSTAQTAIAARIRYIYSCQGQEPQHPGTTPATTA
ncbi:hypothetical protein ACEZCY_14645 [Streptacidiphilus sp. N1-12]|uniref:Uncharacterized protein n=2 Tax=Streptacidiphilus alkalitolerans TaxID=3342712 RepID=A0ABV6V9V5_9ACTN